MVLCWVWYFDKSRKSVSKYSSLPYGLGIVWMSKSDQFFEWSVSSILSLVKKQLPRGIFWSREQQKCRQRKFLGSFLRSAFLLLPNLNRNKYQDDSLWFALTTKKISMGTKSSTSLTELSALKKEGSSWKSLPSLSKISLAVNQEKSRKRWKQIFK